MQTSQPSWNGLWTNAENPAGTRVIVTRTFSGLLLQWSDDLGNSVYKRMALAQVKDWYHTDAHTIIIWQIKEKEQELRLDGQLPRQAENKPTFRPGEYIQTDAFLSSSYWYSIFPILATLVLLLVGGVWFYLYGIPALAARLAESLPREWEIGVGRALHESIRSSHTVYEKESALLTQYITQSDLDNTRGYELDVTVIQSDILNAYAVPGGHIYIHSALLDSLQNPAQLGALLGHEWVHIRNQHTTKSVLSSLQSYLVLLAFFSSPSDLAGIFVTQSENLAQLSYSREMEAEADETALAYMKRNRISQAGLYSLLSLLKRQEKPGTGWVPEILSTHPDIDNRLARAKPFANQNLYECDDSLNRLYYSLKGLRGQ